MEQGLGCSIVSHHVANLTIPMVLPFSVLGPGGPVFHKVSHHLVNLAKPMV